MPRITPLTTLPLALALLAAAIRGQSVPEFHDLFNGRDLAGWVNVNTAPDTWSVENGMLVCSGHPTGVMRTAREYENFVLHVEWMHTEPGETPACSCGAGREPIPAAPSPTGWKCRCSNSTGPS